MPKNPNELRLKMSLDLAMSRRSAMLFLGLISLVASLAGVAATFWFGLQ